MPYKTDHITNCQISFDNGVTFEPFNALPEDIQISAEVEKSNKHRDIYKTKECSFTGSFEVNNDAWNQIMQQVEDNHARWEMHYTYKVQNRRHKKRRINKKWAKRYGYRTIESVIKDLEEVRYV